MNMIKRVGWIAGAIALVTTATSEARPVGDDDLAKRLEAAEAKLSASDAKIAAAENEIAALKAQNQQNWLTEKRSDEIKGLVQDVLADADTRSSLLQSGATSGYDNGFIIGSADGNWLLRINFLMHQRFIYNNFEPIGGTVEESENDESRYGFENTRSRLTLSGHLVNPSWFYRLDINFGTNHAGGVMEEAPGADEEDASLDAEQPEATVPFHGIARGRTGTQNAYLGYDFGNGWRAKVGTMKTPFLREELVEAQYQLAVERSILNYGFTTGYSDGVAFDWTGERFRVMGMFSDGIDMGQTFWFNGPGDEDDIPDHLEDRFWPGSHAAWALTGLAEFMINGTWDQFADFTSPKGGETGILLGAAVHYQDMEEFAGDETTQLEQLRLTGDVSVEFGGWNLYGALIWTDNDWNDGSGNWNPWGWLIQGGFYLDDTWELYGRFEWVDVDESNNPFDTSFEDFQVLTVGVNKYFAGHNAKWTSDFGYGFNGVFSPAAITGWRQDLPGSESDGQWVFRTQVQIYF